MTMSTTTECFDTSVTVIYAFEKDNFIMNPAMCILQSFEFHGVHTGLLLMAKHTSNLRRKNPHTWENALGQMARDGLRYMYGPHKESKPVGRCLQPHF